MSRNGCGGGVSEGATGSSGEAFVVLEVPAMTAPRVGESGRSNSAISGAPITEHSDALFGSTYRGEASDAG